MSGFWGSYSSVLDSKGRINIPVKVRKNLKPEDEKTFIIIRGKNKNLVMYPLSCWDDYIEEVTVKLGTSGDFEEFSLHIMNDATEQTMDKQGRLNLPKVLIDYAELDGEVKVIGSKFWLQIWNNRNYKKHIEASHKDHNQWREEKGL
jgi:MraZ protein